MKKIFVFAFYLILMTNVNAQWQNTYCIQTGSTINYATALGTNVYYAESPVVYYSQNNGDDWISVNTGGTFTNPSSLAINNSYVFLSTFDHGVFSFTHNGSNWTAINIGLIDTIIYSIFATDDIIYVGTSNNGIFLSVNNGASWSAANNGLTNSPVLSIVAKDSIVFAGTQNDGIFISNNYGNTWQSSNNGITDTTIRSLAISDTIVFAGSRSHGLFISSDYGGTWNQVSSGLTDTTIRSLAVLGTNIFAGTGHDGVFLSVDNGGNWSDINDGFDYFGNIMSLAINDSNIFATLGGEVWKRPLSELSLTTSDNNNSVTNPVTNFNIFPNPTDNKLQIVSSTNDKFTIKLVDYTGKVISFDEFYLNQTLDISGLAKGIYLLQIINSKEIISKQIIKE